MKKGVVLAAITAAVCLDGSAAGLPEVIGRTCRIDTRDEWQGGARIVFEYRGCETWVVEPKKPRRGKPWVWIMEWPGAYAERTGVPALLKAGFYIVTFRPGFYEVKNGKREFQSRPGNMNDKRVAESREFQRYVVNVLGLAPKCGLIGMSRGGFYSVRYASFHPDCVERIYLDAPLLDFSTMPGFSGAYYGVNSDTYVGKDDPRQPVNRAEPIAKAGIPIFLLYGGQDQTVPPSQNCELFIKRFQEAGGIVNFTKRPMYGHHPHGLEEHEQDRFVTFFSGN